jgi:hypothetical protein
VKSCGVSFVRFVHAGILWWARQLSACMVRSMQCQFVWLDKDGGERPFREGSEA